MTRLVVDLVLTGGRFEPGRTVEISEGRITAIGPAGQPHDHGTDVVRLSGKALLPGTINLGAAFAFAEMLLHGATTCAEFFYIQDEGNDDAEAVIRAARDVGIRLVLARAMYDWDGATASPGSPRCAGSACRSDSAPTAAVPTTA